MAEITGGELNYAVTVDVDQLKKSLTDAEGNLQGFSDVAELAGEKLDNALKGNVVENLKKIGLQSGLTGKDMKNAIKDAEDFVKGMEAGLKGVLDYQTKLGREINKTPPGEAQATLLQEYDAISTKIEEVSLSIENSKKIVQGFKDENVSLATKLRDVKEEMQQLVQLGQKDSEKYSELSAKAKEYTQNIDQLNAEMKALRGSPGLDLFIESVGLASGVFATTQGVMGLLVGESENLDKIMVQMQATMSVAIGLQQIQNALKSDGTVITRVMAVQELARARATDIASASTGRATIAQRLFNLVANANPYILLATAILTVVGAIALYVAATNEAKKQAEDMAELNKKVADSVAEPLIAFKKLQLQWNALGNDLKAKEKFIKDNKDAFEKLGFSVNNATDAENVFVKNSKAMQAALMLRARAAAATEIATEKYKKGLEAQMADEAEKRILKNGNQDEKAWIEVKRKFRELKGFTTLANEAKENFDSANNLITRSFGYDKAGNDLQKNANIPFVTKTENGKTSTTKSKTTTPKSVADEYFPPGSVAEIQKRMAAIDEALSKATNSKSIEALKNKRIAITEELSKALQKIEIKSLEDRANLQEKYASAYNIIAENYGKETADKMYAPLMEGAQSYYGWLDKEREKLFQKEQGGSILSETDKASLVFLTAKINEIDGKKNAFQNFTDGIDEALAKIPTLSGQIEFLTNKKEELKNTKGNKSFDDGEQKFLKEKNDNLILQQRAFYNDFLKEKQTFEQQKKAIDDKYNSIDAQINSSSNSDEEKSRLLAESAKARGKEYSQAFLDSLKDTSMWEKAFGDIAEMTNREIKKAIQDLKTELEKAKLNGALPSEIKAITDRIKELQNVLNANPFQKIADSFKKLGDETLTTAQKIDAAKNLFQGLGEGVQMIGDAFGGFSEETQQTVNDIMAIGSAAFDLGKSIATGDVAGMITAGIKLIGSIASAVNGDKKKEREIKKQAAVLKELESAYINLGRAIDKALGEKVFDASKAAIENLKQQKAVLEQMIRLEKDKKDSDQDKINGYKDQINSINNSIEDMYQAMVDKALNGLNAKGLADQLADALTTAFQNGEDAAAAMGKTVDKILADMVKNALKMKLLEGPMQAVVDKMLASMGFNKTDNTAQIKAVQDQITALEKEKNKYTGVTGMGIRMKLQQKIDALKSQMNGLINGQSVNGSFDGLTEAERQELKDMIASASQNYTNALGEYEALFGGVAENAMGLKGDIKGITEKTAGALEAQINAIRIYQVEGLSVQRANQQVFIQSLQNLVLIEFNTRRLHSIDASLAEMNSKMKKGLAGLP